MHCLHVIPVLLRLPVRFIEQGPALRPPPGASVSRVRPCGADAACLAGVGGSPRGGVRPDPGQLSPLAGRPGLSAGRRNTLTLYFNYNSI